MHNRVTTRREASAKRYNTQIQEHTQKPKKNKSDFGPTQMGQRHMKSSFIAAAVLVTAFLVKPLLQDETYGILRCTSKLLHLSSQHCPSCVWAWDGCAAFSVPCALSPGASWERHPERTLIIVFLPLVAAPKLARTTDVTCVSEWTAVCGFRYFGFCYR